MDKMEKDSDLIQWLYSNGGPIIRYRTAKELMNHPIGFDIHRLYQEVCECSEVQHWLNNLGQAKNIHGSKDIDAENPLAKLLLIFKIPAPISTTSALVLKITPFFSQALLSLVAKAKNPPSG